MPALPLRWTWSKGSSLPPSTPEARAEAVRALEAEFGELITHFRRVITENANRVSPGMLPGAYKIFTTIARCEMVTVFSSSRFFSTW